MRVTVCCVLAAGMSLFIVVGSNPVGVYNAGAATAPSNTLVSASYTLLIYYFCNSIVRYSYYLFTVDLSVACICYIVKVTKSFHQI